MDIKISEKSLRQFLKTKATTGEIITALTQGGPTVDRFHSTTDDTIMEIEAITNRVDTACVFGVAREANAILNQMGILSELTSSPYESNPINDKSSPPQLNIKIASQNLVPRFTAATFSNCQISASPSDTKHLLEISDQRPLSNLIDLTSELTLLYGLPTHIFDLDKLAIQSLTIREAKNGEKITTLDNQSHDLLAGDIIIEDGDHRIVDLCGIMGGQVAQVDEHTKNILFIAPIYNPKNIRHTSLRLQKRTLAAQIYEKSPDVELPPHILSIANDLIMSRTRGTLSSKIFDYYPKAVANDPIQLNLNWLEKFSGVQIKDQNILSILTNLGFQHTSVKNQVLSTTPPSFRAKDISISEDLAEEIIRVYGYYQIPGTLPLITTAPEKPEPLFNLENQTRQFFSTIGYHEIYNNSLISLDQIKKYNDVETTHLKLTNALSTDYEYLRTSLVPPTLTNHKNNQGKSDHQLNFLEIANIYLPTKDSNLPEEIPTLCVSTTKQVLDLKHDLVTYFAKLNQKNITFLQDEQLSAKIVMNNVQIGYLKQISSVIQNNFGLESPVSVLEINLALLLKNLNLDLTLTPISPFPDLKLEVTLNSELPIGDIVSKIYFQNQQIAKVKYLNSYHNKHSFEITLRSYEENLTKDFATKIQQEISSLF